MGFMVDRGGGLPTIHQQRAPEENAEEQAVDAVTGAAPVAAATSTYEEKPTLCGNGRWLMCGMVVFPWIVRAALFGRVPFVPEQMIVGMQAKGEVSENIFQ